MKSELKILMQRLQDRVDHLIRSGKELRQGQMPINDRLSREKQLLLEMDEILQVGKPLRDLTYTLEEERDNVSDHFDRLSAQRAALARTA